MFQLFMKLVRIHPSAARTHQNLPFGFLVGCVVAVFGMVAAPVFSQEKPSDVEWFGMRLRQIREKTAIYEPVWVAPAPGNEATMVRRKNGDLAIFYINRPGDADKLVSISSKDGIRWTEPVVEFKLPGQAYYANRVLEDAQGRLHAVFHLWSTGTNGYRGRHLDVWYCQKPDAKTAWSQPRKILDGYVGSMRNFCQLRNGRLLMAFAKANPARMDKPAAGQKDEGWNDIVSLYSDDNGQSWKQSMNEIRVQIDNSMPVRYGGIEPSVVELTDGRLWMLIRTNKGRLYESWSVDGGQSWQEARPTRFISSDSPAEWLRLSDNRLILFLNSNQRWDNPHSYAAGGRDVLHAAVSRDEGKTWRGFREVLTMPSTKTARLAKNDRGTAYASAVETTSGNVALVAGQGEAKSIVVFNPNWLDETEAADDFSKGLAQWTLFDADSLIQLTQCSGRSNALQISGSDAVWNFPALLRGTLQTVLEIPASETEVSLALTDHFSVSADSRASKNAVVQFRIKAADRFRNGAKKNRLSVEIRWDDQKQEAVVTINNHLADRIHFHRKPAFGLNYLRIGLTDSTQKPPGLFVYSVRVMAKKTD